MSREDGCRSHPCPRTRCPDNVGGECFAGGCHLNPAPRWLARDDEDGEGDDEDG